jgi:hypothetical protein
MQELSRFRIKKSALMRGDISPPDRFVHRGNAVARGRCNSVLICPTDHPDRKLATLREGATVLTPMRH